MALPRSSLRLFESMRADCKKKYQKHSKHYTTKMMLLVKCITKIMMKVIAYKNKIGICFKDQYMNEF